MSSPADVIPQSTMNRKQRRLQMKKRKIEAFLNLVASDVLLDEEKTKKSKSNEATRTLEDDFKSLQKMKALLKTNQTEGEPTFYLTEHGIKAQVNFKFYNKDNPLGQTLAPLFVEDIQHLLLRGVVGGSSAVTTRWCKIVRDRNVKHVLLLIIDGISKHSVVNNVSSFPHMLGIFENMVEVITPDSYSLNFATEVCGVHLSLGHRQKQNENDSDLGTCNSFKPLSVIFPTDEESISPPNKSYSKLHLLLSPIQLVMEKFPLPKSVFNDNKSGDYCFTKTVYSHVTSESPIYALDCEMCRMQSGSNEVTKVAIIDENYNVIYHTLVKPEGVIADYLTRYSGVTKEMLAPIQTTLNDVQNAIQSLLPPDAILCGQSLNFDLHALKMIHPYIIDTSVIYNTTGMRYKKSALRILSNTFLNEPIQCSNSGHDPVEDSIATMKLVHLKLQNGPQFGDAILMGAKAFANMFSAGKIKASKELQPIGTMKTCEEVKRSNDLSTSFFSILETHKKSTAIIASESDQKHYTEGMVPSSVKRIVKSAPSKIIKHTIKQMDKHHLTVCHLNFLTVDKNEQMYSDIDNYIQRLFAACAEKTLFVAVATGLGQKNDEDTFENALCMVRVKNEFSSSKT